MFDKWQDAVKIWGTIRKDCDDHPENVGQYFLTESASKKIDTPHTGTGRITEMVMYPMTLHTGKIHYTHKYPAVSSFWFCK